LNPVPPEYEAGMTLGGFHYDVSLCDLTQNDDRQQSFKAER
jgi:hypothetical protein